MKIFQIYVAIACMIMCSCTGADKSAKEEIVKEEVAEEGKKKWPKAGFKTEDPLVHDPVMAYENGKYYLFCTGMGVSCLSSSDMKVWTLEESVFDEVPAWIKEKLPNATLHFWAPDIIYHNGEWHLYYCSSAFAKNTSVIGHATNKTLDPKSKDFAWVDRGLVIQSIPYRDDWNAIDPNVVIDEEGTPWMNFGSFWNGMKMFRMNKDLSGVATPEEWLTISKRPRTWTLDDKEPGDGAVEAPFIFKKGKWYYLFVSFDYCCKGKDSTYKVVVGRSDNVKGPYLDKDGVEMVHGGGSLVIEGNGKEWQAVGHNSAYTFDGKDYFIAHAYDSEKGAPHLIIREMAWENEWPVVNW